MDPSYTYGRRILYIDKENFMIQLSANYDQKGRLYRTQMYTSVWMPEIAQLNPYGTHTLQFDHLDLHATFQVQFSIPCSWERKNFSMQEMIKRGK
jgi:hypothetical protein